MSHVLSPYRSHRESNLRVVVSTVASRQESPPIQIQSVVFLDVVCTSARDPPTVGLIGDSILTVHENHAFPLLVVHCGALCTLCICLVKLHKFLISHVKL